MPQKVAIPIEYFFEANTNRVLRLRPERFGDRFDYSVVPEGESPDFSGTNLALTLVGIDYEGEPATPPALYEERYVYVGGGYSEVLPDLALVNPGDTLTPMPIESQYYSTLFKRLRVVTTVPCTVTLSFLADVVEVL